MKISIKTNDGKHFRIPAPIWIIKAALSLAGLGTSMGKRYIPEDARPYVDAVNFHELKKSFEVLKNYKGLTMVEVKSSDGTEVIITI